MKAIQPFAEQGHYTAVHDSIFDVIMPKCPPNAWKILCFVLRKTRGWNKDEDAIPYKQIREGTGIKSDETISNALKWLVKENLLNVARGRDKNGHQMVSAYRLNREYQLETDLEITTEIEVGPTTEIEDGPATEIEVGPTTEIEDINNHKVPQEPHYKKHTPVGAKTSFAAPDEPPKNTSPKADAKAKSAKAKSKDDHVGKLIDDLEELEVYLDRDQVAKYAGNFGRLKSKGVSHKDLVRTRQRIVSEWPRIQLSPQQALSDLSGEQSNGHSKHDEKPEMYSWVPTY